MSTALEVLRPEALAHPAGLRAGADSPDTVAGSAVGFEAGAGRSHHLSGESLRRRIPDRPISGPAWAWLTP